jgi:ankyrin repeat protein
MRLLLEDGAQTPASFSHMDDGVLQLLINPRVRVTSPITLANLLCISAEVGDEKVARLCLEKGGDPRSKNDCGQLPLILAVATGRMGIVRLLLQANADPNQLDDGMFSALHVAVGFNEAGILKALLDWRDADVNITNHNCHTPLHTAAFYGARTLFSFGKVEVMGLLLGHPQVNVNARDSSGRTPLICAAYCGKFNAVRKLLQHPSISVTTEDNSGLTALDWAKKYGYRDIITEIEASLAMSAPLGRRSSRPRCLLLRDIVDRIP